MCIKENVLTALKLNEFKKIFIHTKIYSETVHCYKHDTNFVLWGSRNFEEISFISVNYSFLDFRSNNDDFLEVRNFFDFFNKNCEICDPVDFNELDMYQRWIKIETTSKTGIVDIMYTPISGESSKFLFDRSKK